MSKSNILLEIRLVYQNIFGIFILVNQLNNYICMLIVLILTKTSEYDWFFESQGVSRE